MKYLQEKLTMKPWRIALAGVSLALASPLTWAAAAIQSITSSQQAGSDVVRIELSEPLALVPAGFVVQAPPRIAIDLPSVTSPLGRKVVAFNQSNLRTVNVAQAGERTRLVLNLRQPTTYKAQLQGKTLILVLDPSPASTPAPMSDARTGTATSQDTVHFAEARNAAPLALTDIGVTRAQECPGQGLVEPPTD